MGSVLPSGVLWGMQGRASSWHSQLLAPLSPSASVSSALIPLSTGCVPQQCVVQLCPLLGGLRVVLGKSLSSFPGK